MGEGKKGKRERRIKMGKGNEKGEEEWKKERGVKGMIKTTWKRTRKSEETNRKM